MQSLIDITPLNCSVVSMYTHTWRCNGFAQCAVNSLLNLISVKVKTEVAKQIDINKGWYAKYHTVTGCKFNVLMCVLLFAKQKHKRTLQFKPLCFGRYWKLVQVGNMSFLIVSSLKWQWYDWKKYCTTNTIFRII